jgi:hypothetical protein
MNWWKRNNHKYAMADLGFSEMFAEILNWSSKTVECQS